jgi:archaemetzincin
LLDNSDLPPTYQKLVPLHTPLAKPRPGDWLDRHVELGQSYGQYVDGKTVRSDKERRTIYVQPLGEFNATQKKILLQTAEFLGIYFQLPVRVIEDLAPSVIPDRGWRNHPTAGTPQILTEYVLSDVLKPRLPADAVALIGLTASDLSPGGDWNYVFGQAMLADRVGVWSIHRLGDPDQSDNAFVRTLRRTLHLAAHETGHMFSIEHCIFYECCMNGVNHRDEVDRKPLWLCPQCQAKVAFATGADPGKQFTNLIAFAEAHGLKPEADFWRKSLAAIAMAPSAD